MVITSRAAAGTEPEPYLDAPVVAQLRLLLQLLLQVAVGLGLLGADRCGPEAAVVTRRVTFIQDRAQLGVHGHHDHTWGAEERRDDGFPT